MPLLSNIELKTLHNNAIQSFNSANQFMAEQDWDAAATEYNNTRHFLTPIKNQLSDPDIFWPYFQSCIGEAYALKQLYGIVPQNEAAIYYMGSPGEIDNQEQEIKPSLETAGIYYTTSPDYTNGAETSQQPAFDSEQQNIRALAEEAAIYLKTSPYISELLENADNELWLEYYTSLVNDLHSDAENLPIPASRLEELDKLREFKVLAKVLNKQCRDENLGQSPLYLAIRYNLEKFGHYLIGQLETLEEVYHQTDKNGLNIYSYAQQQPNSTIFKRLEDWIAFQIERKKLYEGARQQFDGQFEKLRRKNILLSPFHLTEERELTNNLRNLLENNSYLEAYGALATAVRNVRTAPKYYKHRVEIKTLFKQIKSPEELTSETGRIYRLLYSNTEIIKVLIKKITTLNKRLQQEEGFSELSVALQKMENCYQEFIETPADSPVVIFYSQDFGQLRVKPEYIGAFLPEFDNHSQVKKPQEASVRIVHQIKGMFLKQDPSFPGVDFMNYSLNNLITSEPCPPTRLIKLFSNNYDKEHLFLASKEVKGVSLNSVCEFRPDELSKIAPTNFTNKFVLSVLTDPQDGHERNYQIQPEFDQVTAEVHRTKIVEVDSDECFAIPVLASPKGHYLDITCIIYLLPNMKQRFDKSAKANILDKKPATIVLKWLQSLQQQNTHYEELIKARVLSKKNIADLQLPIRLAPGTAQTIYDKITHLQKLLREDTEDTLTLDHVLKAMQPLVHRVYEKVLLQEGSPKAALLKIDQATKPSLNAWTIEELLHAELDSDLGNGETIRSYLGKQNAVTGDYISNRTSDIRTEINDFLTHLDCSELSEIDEHALITQIGKSPVPVPSIPLKNTRLSVHDLRDLLFTPLGKDGAFKKNPLQTIHWEQATPGSNTKELLKIAPLFDIDIQVTQNKLSPQSSPETLRDNLSPPDEQISEQGLEIANINKMMIQAASSFTHETQPQYCDQDIMDYLEESIRRAPFDGRKNSDYRVYFATDSQVTRTKHHVFLLSPVDTRPGFNQFNKDKHCVSLPIDYHIDHTHRPVSILANIARIACDADNIEAFSQLLADANEEGNDLVTLSDLQQQFPTWDRLKPALESLIEERRELDLIDEIMQAIANENKADIRILFPYNLEQSHWLAGELQVNKSGNQWTINAFAHDPYGKGRMSKEMEELIQQSFSNRLKRVDASFEVTLHSRQSNCAQLQAAGDVVSCGPIACEIILTRLQNKALSNKTAYPADALALRQMQNEITGRELGEKPQPAVASASKAPYQSSAAINILRKGAPESVEPLPIVDQLQLFNSHSIEERMQERLQLINQTLNLPYSVENNGIAMVLEAIKSSSEKKSYNRFIRLLLNVEFAIKKEASPDDIALRNTLIDTYISQLLVNQRGSFESLLEHIPLNCHGFFTRENFREELKRLAGSASTDWVEPDFHNNLAHIAVLFSTPTLPAIQSKLPSSCRHTPFVAAYFKNYHPILWHTENKTGYSPGDLYQLLHGQNPPGKQLVQGINNKELKTFYQHMISLWRNTYNYNVEWQHRNKKLENIQSRSKLALIAGSLFYVPQMIYNKLYERDVFLSRQSTTLNILAIIDQMIIFAGSAQLTQLNNIRTQLKRTPFNNGSSLKKGLDMVLHKTTIPKRNPLVIVTDNSLSSSLILKQMECDEIARRAREEARYIEDERVNEQIALREAAELKAEAAQRETNEERQQREAAERRVVEEQQLREAAERRAEEQAEIIARLTAMLAGNAPIESISVPGASSSYSPTLFAPSPARPPLPAENDQVIDTVEIDKANKTNDNPELNGL